MSNPTPSQLTPLTGTQLTPVTKSLNKVSSLLTPAVYDYTLDSSSTKQINKAISFNYDITGLTGQYNYAIQFYNQTSGIYNGIEISDSYGNSIIGNLNGTDLDFSANNLFKFTSSKGISVNNNISCNNISCNDISCNDISCNDISCNQLSYITLNPPILQGPTGDQGPTGNQGPTGEQGPTGDQGPIVPLSTILSVGNNCGPTGIDFNNNNIDNVNIINGTTDLALNGTDINLTASTGNIKITPTNVISTTSVPYGLYVDSPLIKTYPTPAPTGFQAYPLYRTTAELGTNQIYDVSNPNSFNFIYGDSRSYTKSANTTSDIERLYFTGFSQSFSWTDANTCKQYIGFDDSFTYSGINANTRVSSIFRADSITLSCPASFTQTITNIRASRDFRINADNTNATYTITNSVSPNLRFTGSATNVIANISNHSFFENSSNWGGNWSGSGSMATITNMYGLRLWHPATNVKLTITNNWGIYSGWALAKNYFAGVVSIGTTTPNSSAVLQVDSTTQGFLPPRMTGVQANAIVSPAEGLMVYITNTTSPFSSKGWWGYNGTTWTQIG
jgi:hypothetical protein